MIHKNKDKKSIQYDKFNGLGGKLHANEDLVAGMQRELNEEAGIMATKYQLKGTLSWPGFGKNGEDHFGFIFLVTDYKGQVRDVCGEGDLSWVSKDKILELNLWESDKYFLDKVFDEGQEMFSGIMPYKNGRLLTNAILYS